jgi:DNA-binding CsgD family transcriptional regulator
MDRHISVADAVALQNLVRTVEATTAVMAERRQQFAERLIEMLDGDVGHWSWGRGHPDRESIAPVAVVLVGYSDAQKGILIKQGNNPAAVSDWHQRTIKLVGDKTQLTTLRRDVFTDDDWKNAGFNVEFAAHLGLDSWIHAIRYPTTDTWCNIFIARHVGREEFQPREAALLDLALASIPWLTPQVEEKVPPERFIGLTPRQRAVLLMQLDGLSRKQIASKLNVTEQTIGDHLKALYKQFEVHSSGELAALFLRGV